MTVLRFVSVFAAVALLTFHVSAATVSWVGSSGDWNIATNWSTGALPGAADDVVIDRPGALTITHSAGAHTVRSIQSEEALTVSGGSLTVSNTVQVNAPFHLAGGTLAAATVLAPATGDTLAVTSGTLDSLTVNGVLDVGRQNNGAFATVVNGLTLNGMAYVGNPTNGWYGRVDFSGSQTLAGNGTVVFGNSSCNTLRLTAGGTTLTLGPNMVLRGHTAQIAYSTCWGGPGNVAVLNQGTVAADLSGGTIHIFSQRFTNEATARALNGGTLTIDALENSATGRVLTDNGTLTLNGTWTNGGVMAATNATVNLGGTVSAPSLGTFQRDGGTVNLTGTLDAGGGAVALNGATGSWMMNGGTLRNAILSVSGGAELAFGSGTLDGVTVNGDLDVGRQNNGAFATVVNGLTLNGMAYVGNPTNGWYGRVDFSGSQTLAGNGTVVFGNSSCNTLRLTAGGTTLTLGPNMVLRGHTAQIAYSTCWGGPGNVAVLNQGTISADVGGGNLYLFGQNFSSTGQLSAGGGALLRLAAQTNVSTGTVDVLGTGVVELDGSVSFNASHGLDVESGAVFRVSGNLLGDVANAADFTPRGGVIFDGAGTAASPQRCEVMSRDVQASESGYSNNFAYGTFTLTNNNYVRLVDTANNAPGNDPEAVYVDHLNVPHGCTLDLNGLRLYVRTASVSGTVIDGAAMLSFNADFTANPASQGIEFARSPVDTSAAGYWHSGGGYAVLTDATNNQYGKILFPILNSGEPVGAFTAAMRVRLGGSTCCTRVDLPSPADGLSLSFAALDDPAATAAHAFGWVENPEEGVTNGISVCIDTWDNLGGEAPNIDLKVDGKLIATAPFAGLYRIGGPAADPVLDGLGNPLDLRTGSGWADLSFSLNHCGNATVVYKGVTIFDDVATGFIPRGGRFVIGGRTGGANDNHHVDDVSFYVEPASSGAYVSGLIPAQATEVPQDSPIGFVITQRTPVDTNSIQLTLNGSPVAATVTIQAATTNVLVQYSPPVRLSPGSEYVAGIRFRDINGTSCEMERSFTTTILNAGTLFIEVEDFNFSDSDGVNPGQHIEFGAPDGSLLGRDATFGIDVQDDVGLNDAVQLYRASSGVEAAKGPNSVADQSKLRGSREITADWVLAWAFAGEWLNYTRTFPAGRYYPYIRWGSGAVTDTPMAAELGEVTTNPSQTNQSVTKIGEFRRSQPTGGWEATYTLTPLSDTSGNPVSVFLRGKKTLRLTVLPGAFDCNYLMFVPDLDAPILRPVVGVTPANGASTPNRQPLIRAVFTNREAAVVAPSLRLLVNGSDVTASASIMQTALGGEVTYQVPQPGFPVLSTVQVRLVFTDDAAQPLNHTNDWSFIVRGILITEQPTDQVAAIGGGASFQVTATATDPPLQYQWFFNDAPIAGATDRVLSIGNVQPSHAGAYKVVISNTGGAVTSSVAALSILVPPPTAAVSPASTNVPVGGSATFCAQATGVGPFTYQWRRNGVNLTNETNVCIVIDKVQLSDGGAYTVAIANTGGATLSEPALLLIDLPINQGSDSVTNRIPLAGNAGSLSGTNTFAARDPNEPKHSGKPGGKSIWYQWTPSSNGIARLHTLGSTFDTLLGVYVQCGSNLVEVAGDDDSGENLTSIVEFNAAAGTNYLIAVDGFGGADGTFALTWSLSPSSDPLPLVVRTPQSVTVAPGETAGFEVEAVAGASITYSPCQGPPVTNTAVTLAYQWFFNGVPLSGATNRVLTIANVQESNLGQYAVSVRQANQAVTPAPAALQLNLTGEQAQNVQAHNKFDDAAANQGIELGTVTAPPPPPLLGFAMAQSASVVRGYTGTQVFSTTNATSESSDQPICGVIGGASQWITFVSKDTGTLYLNTDGSSYNTVMALFVRSGNNLQMVTCDNNSGLDGRDSALSVPVQAGSTNFVMVDGVNGQKGTLRLNYSLVIPSAIAVTGVTINGDLQLQIIGRPDMHLLLESSSNLQTWSVIADLSAPSGTLNHIDSAPAGPQKFYRAALLPW